MKKDDFLKIVRANMKTDPTDQELAFFGSMGEAVEKAFQADSVTRKKEIDDLTAMLGTFEEGANASSVIRSLAQKVDDLEAKAKRSFGSEEKFKLKSMLVEKKDEIVRAMKNTKNGQFSTNDNWAIEFRAKRAASAMMTTSTVLTGAQAINTMNVLDDMEVLVIQYPKNWAIDVIGGRQVSKVPAVWRWKEQNTESDGDAAAVAEGAQKPLTDKAFVWKQADRTKYAGRIEFTEELAMDFDQLLLQIIDMFEDQVVRAWNDGVQTLLVAYCNAYTTTELDGTFYEPSVSQVVQAGKLHVENSEYEADVVMLNPGDAALAIIAQGNDGHISYLPESIAFHGLTPFISTNVPDGKVIVGSSRTVSEQHSNFILRRGMYGDQFIENEETIVGEVFSNLKLPTISNPSWIILDKATVIAALKKGV
jgi:hypothetical protein